MANDKRKLTAQPHEAGTRLDKLLAGSFPDLSRSRIQSLIKSGMVTVDGRTAKQSACVSAGAAVEINIPAPEPAALKAEAIRLDVLYEDRDIAVLNKPAGMVVHPAPGHDTGTLVNALLSRYTRLGGGEGIGGELRPGIVHRLDRDTSGVMIIARNDAAMRSLGVQFRDRTVEKEYLALVWGRPPRAKGVIKTGFGRSGANRKKMAVRDDSGRQAVSRYEVVRALGGASLLRVRIETGRTHQIRVHMAHMGCPVAGDAVYGSGRKQMNRQAGIARQMLHAERLSFNHPRSGRRMELTAPLPRDMKDAVARLEAKA